MNRRNKKSPRTKRRRRIAKMPDKAVLNANQAKKIKAELLIANASEAEQVAAALIRFERALRRRGTKPLGIGPWSRLAAAVQDCRRKLQEDAGLVMTNEQVKQLLENERQQREL
jgi:hypothetical protein